MAEEIDPAAEPASGAVTIADTVIAKVAHMACREVAGVSAMGGVTSRAFSSIRGGESQTQGVAVDVHDDAIDLDITLVVEYGSNIPEVAEACRARAKEQVEATTGMTVRAVNVVVGDVHFPEGAADATGQQA